MGYPRTIQLNDFEASFLDTFLTESGVNAGVRGSDIVFEDAPALSQYAILTTANAGAHWHGIETSAVSYSKTFRRMIVVQGLCAVDVANRHIDARSNHGFKAMEKIASLAGGEATEVYAATCHVVRPLVDQIMARWMRDPTKIDIISGAAGTSEAEF